MKFSKDTIAILKNFSTINGGLMLRPGNTILTRNTIGSSYGEAEIQDDIDIEAAIYDLNGFLSILTLVGEQAEVSVSDDASTIIIKDQRSTIKWPAADPSTITFPNKKIPFPVACVIFDLKGADLQQLMRVAGGLNIETFVVTNENGKIVINGHNPTEDTDLTRALYSLQVADYDGADFKFIINKTNMKSLLTTDYKVMLWAKGEGGNAKFAAKFEGTQSSYVLAMEAGSSHSFE